MQFLPFDNVSRDMELEGGLPEFLLAEGAISCCNFGMCFWQVVFSNNKYDTALSGCISVKGCIMELSNFRMYDYHSSSSFHCCESSS